MSLGVYYLRSANNNNDPDFDRECREFLTEVGQSANEPLMLVEKDTFIDQPIHVFFVASGGSEQLFREIFQIIDGPYYLLTRKSHNSLAAAMEIMGFLSEKGLKGEILHGDARSIGKKIATVQKIASLKKRLKSFRLGTTGESSWLISSKVDRNVLEDSSGMKMLDISFDELLSEVKKNTYKDNQFTLEIKRHPYDRQEIERALSVYGAIRRLVDRYALQGITVRCFDLLGPTCITGCLALAILNAEGIYAACEGDGRSLVSMTILGELTGQPIFMANPSRLEMESNEIVLAHCILPLNMPERYQLNTHFESGLGISVSADLPLGKCTIFKCKENLKEYYAQAGEIVQNMKEGCLCRTQIRVKLHDRLDYFLKKPIANHHMICLGDHKALIDEFFNQ